MHNYIFDELDEAKKEIERLTRLAAGQAGRLGFLEHAIKTFLVKYDEIKPAVDSAFFFQQNHGFAYTGPNWGEELDALRAAVS